MCSFKWWNTILPVTLSVKSESTVDADEYLTAVLPVSEVFLSFFFLQILIIA